MSRPSTAASQWLLLVHQLPPRPVALRVKIWRRLKELGALAVKNSVYVLPDRGEAREDFEWVRAEIAASGGSVTVFQASAVDGVSHAELREMFRRDRKGEYERITKAIDVETRRVGRGRASMTRGRLEKIMHTHREALAAAEKLDHFSAEGRLAARGALARLEAAGRAPDAAKSSGARLSPASFRGKRWTTRPRPGVDRMASAWLIRRFVDRKARFAFGEPGARRAAGTVTFDMFGGDFTHEGNRCTFEVLCERFRLRDERLADIAQLVHDLDLKDGRFGRVEAPMLGVMIEGLRRKHRADGELLDRGIDLFESLYLGGPVA